MNNNKKILIISILFMLTFVFALIGVLLLLVNNQKNNLTNNIDKIQDNYVTFSSNLTPHIETRKALTEKLEIFDSEDYASHHEEYQQILKDYDKNLKHVKSIAKKFEPVCKIKYEDANANILCKSYQLLYEEMVNIYVTNIKEYNNKITEYNEKNGKDYKLHPMIFSDYIDYNKDGVYRGK